jgi:hypothetical protein
MKKLYFIIGALLLSGCEKDNMNGRISIGLTNLTQNNYSLSVFLDGTMKGTFIASQRTNGVAKCDDQDPTRNNVYVLTLISKGSHRIELKETGSDVVKAAGTLSIAAGGCGIAQMTIQ